MPTNFTVVPVDDGEGGSHSSAAAGSSKPSTLGQLFKAEQDGDSSPEAITGSVRHKKKLLWENAFRVVKKKLFSWGGVMAKQPSGHCHDRKQKATLTQSGAC